MTTPTPPRSARLLAATFERIHLRALIVVGLVLLAYHYSFLTLSRDLTLQTPLAFIALVPVLAVALAWATTRHAPPGGTINDRQVDYIIGIGLVSAAAAIALLTPMSLGAEFWVYRVDLLSIPLFAGGLICIFFGVRQAWLLRWPLGFLLLAWPIPYLPILGDATRSTVDVTISILSSLSAVTPWVHPAVVGSDVFVVQHDGGSFVVSVTAACSGLNGLVGFGLQGLAVQSILRGPLTRRIGWLVGGLALVLALNVVRIEAIFAIGSLLGPVAALEMLHPVAGLAAFGLVLIAMLLLAPRFGLELRKPLLQQAVPKAVARSHVTRIRGAVVVGLTLAVGFAAVNAAYIRFEPGGQPRPRPEVRSVSHGCRAGMPRR